MVVYDITNEKSFDNIREWIKNIEQVSTMVVVLWQHYVWGVCTLVYIVIIILYGFLNE